MLYFNASHDANFGASLPQGPWDTARAHGKLWVIEDDQRTSFGQQAKGACGWDWGTGSHSCAFLCDLLACLGHAEHSFLWILVAKPRRSRAGRGIPAAEHCVFKSTRPVFLGKTFLSGAAKRFRLALKLLKF